MKSKRKKTPIPILLPDTISKAQQLMQILNKRGETLERLIKNILPDVELRACVRLREILEKTADGVVWTQIEQAGFFWREVSEHLFRPQFNEVWKIARESGDAYRREIRESTAHSRAIFGHEKQIYQYGKLAGHVNEVDNRLLEFLLKADNPTKYRDQSNINIQNNVISTVVELHRE